MPDNFQAAGRREVLWGHPADLERKEAGAIYQAVEVRDAIWSRSDRGFQEPSGHLGVRNRETS
jgi:hypothetical protein